MPRTRHATAEEENLLSEIVNIVATAMLHDRIMDAKATHDTSFVVPMRTRPSTFQSSSDTPDDGFIDS